MDYQEFIANKKRKPKSMGFEPSALPSDLFDWQSEIVKWACRRGRAALFEDCGLGKTLQQLAWADQVCKHTDKPVLLLTPLGVRGQTIREAERFGIDGCYAANDSSEVRPCGVAIANYEKLHKFDCSVFSGVVLDECFPKGTLVDVVDENGFSATKHIEKILPGDKIKNAVGSDRVLKVKKRKVSHAVVVYAGKKIVSSPNHPFFTQRGWIGAQDLEPGDSILSSSAAMRMVQYGISPQGYKGSSEVLRSILLSEMADVSARASCESSYAGGQGQAGEGKKGVVCVGIGEGEIGDRASSEFKSNVEPRSQGEGIENTEGHEPQTFRAWWEWDRLDITPEDFTECTWANLGHGVCLIVGETTSRVSHMLQDRLGKRRNESRYRGGWSIPSQSKGPGCKENCEADFIRVEGIEVLEQGHPELERLRDACGELYFYDLEAERHPSFSVSGLLVHNSSVLKNFTGKIKRALCEQFSAIPYRLACTATPAPNDLMEIGNHSEFLGVMPSNEMLSRWFINDTMKAGGYRLKKHAMKDFWGWVSSWAIGCSKPSDLGDYSDVGYDLPELRIDYHIAQVEIAAPPGFLFPTGRTSATTLHNERRQTAPARAEIVADQVNGTDDYYLVWCDTDYEADELKRRVKGAIEVRGSDKESEKEAKLHAFSSGQERVMITKPTIAGFGLNWQHCCKAMFVGKSFSYEQFYQATCRIYRFGQKRVVETGIVLAEGDGAILESTIRKEMQHKEMMRGIASVLKQYGLGMQSELQREDYSPKLEMEIPKWLA